MRRKMRLVVLLCFSASALMAQSVTPPAKNASSGDAVVPVTLGQPVVALTGPWKFRIGDDPRWADPEFDDSGWQPYELMSSHSPVAPDEVTQSGELPGWQQHGHPGYTGYAWYRIRLRLPENDHPLALLMPGYVDDAYEVYVNGAKIGAFGKLNGWRLIYAGQPKFFSMPVATPGGGQPVTLALRFWNERLEASPGRNNLAGGLRGVPLIGPSALLRVFEQSMLQQRWQILGEPRVIMRIAALYAAVGLISLFLFLFSRDQKEYLWAGISLTSFGAMLASIVWMVLGTISVQLSVVAQTLAITAAVFAMPMTAMYLLDVPRPFWRRANYMVSALDLTWSLQMAGFTLGLLPPTSAAGLFRGATLLLATLSIGCLLLAIAIDGVRTIGRKAWLPMTPGMLFALYCVLYALFSIGIFKGSYRLPAFTCACVPLAVLIIFLMRFTEQQRENVRLADDMRQAQEVQQVILPEHRIALPGLEIESEYRPAREVGGDFFQIIPYAADESLLVIAGDVAGKGLKAGMLVALLVGSIRTAAETDSDPAAILTALNRRLLGRGDARATCLALHIARDGAAVLANAGHLPPYLNGQPMEIEGSLPLGLVEELDCSVLEFRLSPSDRLVLVSDGVPEATDEQGELFGFERVMELMRSGPSAAAIAETAQAFGQEDDISVISVTRAPVAEPAAQPALV